MARLSISLASRELSSTVSRAISSMPRRRHSRAALHLLLVIAVLDQLGLASCGPRGSNSRSPGASPSADAATTPNSSGGMFSTRAQPYSARVRSSRHAPLRNGRRHRRHGRPAAATQEAYGRARGRRRCSRRWRPARRFHGPGAGGMPGGPPGGPMPGWGAIGGMGGGIMPGGPGGNGGMAISAWPSCGSGALEEWRTASPAPLGRQAPHSPSRDRRYRLSARLSFS